MGRNTPILQEIIGVLSDEIDDDQQVLHQLESHFYNRLLVDAGNVTAVGAFAEQKMGGISVNQTLRRVPRGFLDFRVRGWSLLGNRDSMEQLSALAKKGIS